MSKRLQSLAGQGKAVMAWPLLCLLIAAVLEQGCILPQDDQVLPDLPAIRNTSPRLVRESATPAQRGATIQLGANCMDFPFAIGVQDPNEGDTIRSKFFVDHDVKFTTTSIDGISAPGTKIIKPVQSQFYAALKLANPDGLNKHFVTVVVSDHEFKPGGIDITLETFKLPDGGITSQTSEPDQYQWEVLTDPNTPCQ